MGREELISDQGLRIDGRRNCELRSFYANSNHQNQETSADGSCYLEIGNTKLLCSVYGPMSSTSSDDNNMQKATLDVEFSVASFASMTTRTLKRDKRLLEMAILISKSMQAAVMLDAFPKCKINVFIQVLQSDGGLLAAGINATTIALVDAGIPMSSYTSAVSVGIDAGKKKVVLDLSFEEEASECGVLTMACCGDGRLALLSQECRMHVEWLQEMIEAGRDACQSIHKMIDEAVRNNQAFS